MKTRVRVTDAAAIDEELRRTRMEAVQSSGSHGASVVTLNFIVYLDESKRRDWVLQRALRVAEKHPARLIVLDATNADGAAEISTIPRHPHDLTLLSDRIDLAIGGLEAEPVAGAVHALLLRDIPTVLWWTASKLAEDETFAALAELASSVVVDSSGSARDEATIAELAALLDRKAGIGVQDLAFMRLAPWQETVAQFFDDPALFEDIFSIVRLEIDAGSEAEGLYLAGWLASRLEWDVRDRHTFHTRDGRTIPFVETKKGEQRRVLRIALATATTTYTAALSEDDENVVCLCVAGEKARAKPCVPLQSIDNTSLLERAILDLRPHAVFDASLRTVRDLLKPSA